MGWIKVQGSILLTWINFNPAWTSDYIHYKVWDEITDLFPNFNGEAVEVWEWISNFIPHISVGMWLFIHVSKMGPSK